MKIRTVVLWVIVLVVIEQFIKLIISKYYQDINFEIIPSLFEFKPTLNNKSLYWLGLMGIDVGRWDYIYLKPLFVFDLKDVYVNCFTILFLISYVKNKKYLNSKFLWGK